MKKNHIGTSVCVLLLCLFSATNQSCQKTEAPQVNKDNWNALPHTKQFDASVTTKWYDVATEVTRTKPYTSGQALRIFAYMGLGMYEAVVPGMPSYQSVFKHFTGKTIEFDKKKDYYWPACANAAAARIATRVMQQYPTPNLSTVTALEAELNADYALKITPEQLQRSNEFGVYVADLIVEWSQSDGTLNPDGTLAVCPPYTLVGGPGNWVPTAPGFFPAVGQCQGNLRTFIPNIVNTVLAPPPPTYSTEPTSAYYLAAKEVFDERNSITDAESKLFNNWRDGAPNYSPLAHMLRITTGIIRKENMNLEDAVTIYAKQTIASSDAIGATFYSKFYYSLQRPMTYIRNVIGQSTWLSLPLTPQTPSYPDELSATASSVAVLEKVLGTQYQVTDSVHKATHGEWTYASLSQIAEAVVEARVNGGTSFRFGGQAGIAQGRTVGNLVDQIPFKK